MNTKIAATLAALAFGLSTPAAAQSGGWNAATDRGPDLTPGAIDPYGIDRHRYVSDAAEPDRERYFQILATRDGDAVLAFLGEMVAQDKAWAMMQLGAFYAAGDFVAYDPVASLNWFAMAAREGNAKAALVLGAMYARGTVIEADPVKARYWLSEASRLGDYRAKRDVERVAAEL